MKSVLWYLDLGLPTSRTVRKSASVVQDTEPVAEKTATELHGVNCILRGLPFLNLTSPQATVAGSALVPQRYSAARRRAMCQITMVTSPRVGMDGWTQAQADGHCLRLSVPASQMASGELCLSLRGRDTGGFAEVISSSWIPSCSFPAFSPFLNSSHV